MRRQFPVTAQPAEALFWRRTTADSIADNANSKLLKLEGPGWNI
jgi:hypothetical protein